jgi:glycosyltransferase involved in cell wall biosynthesis
MTAPKKKLVRITTVPISLEKLLSGQLHFMTDYYDVIGVSSGGEKLDLVAKKENIRVQAVELTRKITPLKDLKAVFHLYRFLKKEKPFIVHSHTPKAGTIGMLAAKLAGVPHRLHTVAGLPLLEATGKKRKVLDFVEKITYSCATKVYPNSKGLKEIIIQNGYCAANKLEVLANGSSNGIDTSHFNPDLITESQKATLRAQLGIQENDKVFIFVGRLVKDKGINELIAAFDKLSQTHSQVKLLLVGRYEPDLDPLQPETLALIESNKAIISAGYQIDVRPYFGIADALVFPSYREGFPNVVMQAGAMRLPCIVSDINGCNEIVIEGQNGFIIPVKSEQAIFEAMQKLSNQPQLIPMLREKARELILSRYEQRLVWQAVLEEYRKLELNR